MSSRAMRDALLGQGEGRHPNVSDEDFIRVMPCGMPNPYKPGEELSIDELDLHIDENRKAHHTDEYEHDILIVRRGQGFDITIPFQPGQSAYDPSEDKVIVHLTTGSRPQESKGTCLYLPVESAATEPNQWQARLKSKEDSRIDVTIHPSCEAAVGSYRLRVHTERPGSNGWTQFANREYKDPILVIFNAWCKDDDVYMEDEAERREYVLNENGRIWVGGFREYSIRAWNFGQFDDVCLNAALYLMDKAELRERARSSPVHVTRCMSSQSNSMDNAGVLAGCWKKKFPAGTISPLRWTGSVGIIEKYMKSKQPVCFGQCWVFSGVVTTLMRALGIPTRTVTNFESAHDRDTSMTIDFHVDEFGDPIKSLNDSVWNFHVWNESFFRRRDIPGHGGKYDGWQAHDATPQKKVPTATLR